MDRRTFCHQLFGSGIVVGSMASLINSAMLVSAATGTTKVQWQKSLKAAQKLALQQDKPMMIVFSASWCTFCHKLDRETFADKRIASFIEREFIPVHLDYDKEPKVAKILDVERLPCTVFLTPQADLLLRSEGFANPKDFQSTLTTALDKRTEIQQVRASTISR
jgi:thiol-disulfide isomerase/thioredoxin